MALEDKVEREVAAIGGLSREELADRWQKAYGCTPPKGVKRALLERSAAWHLQAKRLGGLSAEARKLLRQASKAGAAERLGRAATMLPQDVPSANRTGSAGAGATVPRAALPAKLRPGARLMREWNGRTYIIEVVEGGFQMDGKSYRSLSAIAMRITGARWSGPRFFGL